MALQPPKDFEPVCHPRRSPGADEVWAVWCARESRRAARERARQWREVVEGVRRDVGGALRAVSDSGVVSGCLRDGRVLGPRSRRLLRPVPGADRVLCAGVDTWSVCWYADPGSPLARAMGCLASDRVGRACLVPGEIVGYRVGWFPEWGLVFAEGRPCGDELCSWGQLCDAFNGLKGLMVDLGIPVGVGKLAGVRRLDVAVDLWMGSGLEGLVFLECVGASSFGGGKVAVYRGDRQIESVLVKSRAGRSRGRVYDKGWESGGVSRGRWIRLEGQWRFSQGNRPRVEGLSAKFLRDRFSRRFRLLWQASSGCGVGGLELVVDRVAAAVEDGQLRESRARSVVGYLVLSAAGVYGGAKRTTYELERECRELGLSVSMLEGGEWKMDVATVLEECMSGVVWGVE